MKMLMWKNPPYAQGELGGRACVRACVLCLHGHEWHVGVWSSLVVNPSLAILDVR